MTDKKGLEEENFVELDFEDGNDGKGRSVFTQTSPKNFANKAMAIINAYTHLEYRVISLEQFKAFVTKVRASSLSDEGLTSNLQICPSKSQGEIVTFIGRSFYFNNFTGLRKTLNWLNERLIITTKEAMTIETQARLEATKMPEQNPWNTYQENNPPT